MAQKNRHMSIFIDIMSYFLDDYNKVINIRGLSREVRINRQTVSDAVKKMIDEKIFKTKTVGRNKMLMLDFKSYKTQLYINIAETRRSIEKLGQKELKIIIPELLREASAIILFGSYSSSTQKKGSDIDIIVLDVKDKDSFEKKIKKYPFNISFEYSTISGFGRSIKNSALGKEILKNHTFFGKIDQLVETFIRHQTKA